MCLFVCVSLCVRTYRMRMYVSMFEQSYVIISTFNISPTNTHTYSHTESERSAKVNAFVRGSINTPKIHIIIFTSEISLFRFRFHFQLRLFAVSLLLLLYVFFVNIHTINEREMDRMYYHITK